MHISRMLRSAQRTVSANSPELLTALGVVGTFATALLTARATVLAVYTVYAQETEIARTDPSYPSMERREIFESVWKFYIPPASAAVATCVAVIAANRVQNNRTAVIAAAYTLSERAYSQYRNRVVEHIGAEKDRDIRDGLKQDRVQNDPLGDREVIITGDGDVLSYDEFTGRYFKSNMEALRKAQNDVNYMILNNGYASLSDLYYAIGIAPTRGSDSIGWQSAMELDITAVLSANNVPCLSMSFDLEPQHRFDKFL